MDLYSLQNIVLHFRPKLTHPAALSLCDSWAACKLFWWSHEVWSSFVWTTVLKLWASDWYVNRRSWCKPQYRMTPYSSINKLLNSTAKHWRISFQPFTVCFCHQSLIIIIIIIIIIITRLVTHVKSFTKWRIASAGGHESAKVRSAVKFSLYQTLESCKTGEIGDYIWW